MSFFGPVLLIAAFLVLLRIYGTYRDKAESAELLRQASKLTPEQTKQRISECKAALCFIIHTLQSPNAYDSLYCDNIKKVTKILKIMRLHVSMLKCEVGEDDRDYDKRVFNYLICEGILTADRFWEMHSLDKKDKLWKAEDWTLIFNLSDSTANRYDKMLEPYLNIEFEKSKNPYRRSYVDDMYMD